MLDAKQIGDLRESFYIDTETKILFIDLLI